MKKILPQHPNCFDTQRRKREKRWKVYKVEGKIHIAFVYGETKELALKVAQDWFRDASGIYFEMVVVKASAKAKKKHLNNFNSF